MTKQETIEALWEAYKAGMTREKGSHAHPFDIDRETFLHWINENYPDLLTPEKYVHFDIMCKCDEDTPLLKERGCCCYD